MNTNNAHQTQSIPTRTWLPTAVGLAAAVISATLAPAALANDNRAPEVPEGLEVPEGHKVHFHGFAIGVQIYTWNGADWGQAVPRATLFDDEGNVVIEHSAGPTWTSNSGSAVVGVLPPVPAIVDNDAIPWLRLAADPLRTHGPGILAETTFIHRVNTVGGKAPRENGITIGQIAEVPYIADYFFYRQTNSR